jgi:hypothetical protein
VSRPHNGDQRAVRGVVPALSRLRCELLERLAGKRPVRVIVIDTFGCGHARAYNTRVDVNGQARCVMCRQARRKAA